jgi:aspartyl-tRNA(Asn)/glutamyl-tRNA(Gln) amidotransferase subunit C
MADLTRDDLLNLAKLAHLELDEDELTTLKEDINHIIGYVDQLKSIDLKAFEPTSQVTGLNNVMRADEPIDYHTTQDQLLKNAPELSEDKHIKVRKVL